MSAPLFFVLSEDKYRNIFRQMIVDRIIFKSRISPQNRNKIMLSDASIVRIEKAHPKDGQSQKQACLQLNPLVGIKKYSN